MIREGLVLMVVGMVTVFAFLTALVGSLSLMAGVFRRFAGDTQGTEDTVARDCAAVAASFAYHLRRRGSDETD